MSIRKQFLLLTGAILLTLTAVSSPASAQMGNFWPSQQNIPLYDPETEPPFLIADKNRTVHAFSSQSLGTEDGARGIVYNQWNIDTGWTIPVDIIFPPFKLDARILGAYMDHSDVIHIVFFSGDETAARIFYTQAPAIMADQAQAWTRPLLIGQRAIVPENGTIAGDGNGNLVIVYNGNERGKGFYAALSDDGGSTWGEPVPIYLTVNFEFTPFHFKSYLGQSGQLYTVWSVQNRENHGLMVLFSTLDFDTQQWSTPSILAETSDPSLLGTYLPSIIEYHDNLFMTYYDGSTTGHHYFRQSSDFGETWTRAYAPFPHIGLNGPMSFAVDSNDDLHLFWAQRIDVEGGSSIHGVWHSVWDDQSKIWSPYESIVRGEKILDRVGFTSFDPETVRSIVSQGNVILLVWRTDRGSKGNGIWYSYSVMDAPELPVEPLKTPPAGPTTSTPETIKSTFLPDPTSTPIPVTINSEDPGGSITELFSNPNAPIIGAIITVIVLLGLFVLLIRLSPFSRSQ